MFWALFFASALTSAAGTEAGQIDVEGGVNQDLYDVDHPGYRCDTKTPLFFTVQGPALVYAEIWSDTGMRGKKPSFFMWKNHALMDLSQLEPFDTQKGKAPKSGAHIPFAMEVAAGPQRYTLKCPKGPLFLIKLWSVEKVPKKTPFATDTPR
jgi:hypothetical protein